MRAAHPEILKECICHGKQVVCEKPISNNIENGAEMVKLIKSHSETKVLIG